MKYMLSTLLLLLVALATQSFPLQPNWGEVFQSGQSSMDSQDYEEAKNHFHEALAIAKNLRVEDSRVFKSYDALGLAYFLTRDYEQSCYYQGHATSALLLSDPPPSPRALKGCKVRYYRSRLGAYGKKGATIRNRFFLKTYQPVAYDLMNWEKVQAIRIQPEEEHKHKPGKPCFHFSHYRKASDD